MAETQLDPTVREELDRIQSKDVNDLNAHDKDFLRARRDYLGRNARKKYAHILDQKPEQINNELDPKQVPDSTTQNPYSDTKSNDQNQQASQTDDDGDEE
jgi:hypothetical protein